MTTAGRLGEGCGAIGSGRAGSALGGIGDGGGAEGVGAATGTTGAGGGGAAAAAGAPAVGTRIAPITLVPDPASVPRWSSVGSNMTETSPKRTTVPGPSATSPHHAITIHPGAIGGVVVNQNPDPFPPLQLGVGPAHAVIRNDQVIVVRAADVHDWHPHGQALALQRRRCAPGRSPWAPWGLKSGLRASAPRGSGRGVPCMVWESRSAAPAAGRHDRHRRLRRPPPRGLGAPPRPPYRRRNGTRDRRS